MLITYANLSWTLKIVASAFCWFPLVTSFFANSSLSLNLKIVASNYLFLVRACHLLLFMYVNLSLKFDIVVSAYSWPPLPFCVNYVRKSVFRYLNYVQQSIFEDWNRNINPLLIPVCHFLLVMYVKLSTLIYPWISKPLNLTTLDLCWLFHADYECDSILDPENWSINLLVFPVCYYLLIMYANISLTLKSIL